MGIVSKAVGVYKRYGLSGFIIKLNEKIQSPMRSYSKRAADFLPTEEELEKQRAYTFPVEPVISIVVPAYETKEEFLNQLLASLEKQSYDNWELCIADGSTSDAVENVIRKKQECYSRESRRYRIQYQRLKENNGISENTNEGLKLVTGSYVGFMDHDDVLELNALYEVVKVINDFPDVDVIYSDEDKVSYDLGRHTQPHFKTDFNLELLRDNNYICHFLVVSKSLLEQVKGFRKEFDGSQDYDFILRCVEQAKQVKHIPKILYHWRMHSASTAGDSDSKTYTFDAGQRAVAEHLKRMQIPAEVEKRIEVGCFHVKYKPKIPYRKEEYILMMPEGVVPVSDGWEEEFYSYLSQERVGIVGGKTFDKNGKVRQNGLIFSADGTIYPAFHGLNSKYKGYCRRAVLAQEVSAVSFEFAMIKKEAYEKAGGFRMELPHPYREMDFCLRLRKAGYAVVLDPYAQAVVEKELRLEEDESMLSPYDAKEELKKKLEQENYDYDPCYNPNFSGSERTFTIE